MSEVDLFVLKLLFNMFYENFSVYSPSTFLLATCLPILRNLTFNNRLVFYCHRNELVLHISILPNKRYAVKSY